MRLRHVVLLTFAVCLYMLLCYVALEVVPNAIVSNDSYTSLGAAEREQLLVNARNSVRTAAVTLLTGSVLGVAGFVGLLAFVNARREAERNERESQDSLFSSSLKSLDQINDSAILGAVAVMASVANRRIDLQGPASAVLFSLVRGRRALTASLSPTPDQLNVADLTDRDALSAACLRFIGELPLAERQVNEGAIMRRKLSGCDLRRLEVDNVRYELVNFTGTYFWESRLAQVTFVKCILKDTDWRGARLDDVRFEDCDVRLADFSSATRTDVEFLRCIGL
jgi:hypothetical protein